MINAFHSSLLIFEIALMISNFQRLYKPNATFSRVSYKTLKEGVDRLIYILYTCRMHPDGRKYKQASIATSALLYPRSCRKARVEKKLQM